MENLKETLLKMKVGDDLRLKNSTIYQRVPGGFVYILLDPSGDTVCFIPISDVVKDKEV